MGDDDNWGEGEEEEQEDTDEVDLHQQSAKLRKKPAKYHDSSGHVGGSHDSSGHDGRKGHDKGGTGASGAKG